MTAPAPPPSAKALIQKWKSPISPLTVLSNEDYDVACRALDLLADDLAAALRAPAGSAPPECQGGVARFDGIELGGAASPRTQGDAASPIPGSCGASDIVIPMDFTQALRRARERFATNPNWDRLDGTPWENDAPCIAAQLMCEVVRSTTAQMARAIAVKLDYAETDWRVQAATNAILALFAPGAKEVKDAAR